MNYRRSGGSKRRVCWAADRPGAFFCRTGVENLKLLRPSPGKGRRPPPADSAGGCGADGQQLCRHPGEGGAVCSP